MAEILPIRCVQRKTLSNQSLQIYIIPYNLLSESHEFKSTVYQVHAFSIYTYIVIFLKAGLLVFVHTHALYIIIFNLTFTCTQISNVIYLLYTVFSDCSVLISHVINML